MKWTEDRRKELSLLQTLLSDVQSINTGSGALERIRKCVDIAAKLDKNEVMKNPRAGFVAFLYTLAADEAKHKKD